jgi:hypothetical protein
MAIYPDDAVISSTAFNTIGTRTYTNTGATTEFVLPTVVERVAEVLVTVNSNTTLDTTEYYLSNSGGSVVFQIAPAASNLTIRTLDVPERFRTIRTFPATHSVVYSNTFITTVEGNNYIINGVRNSFAIPSRASGLINNANNLIVTLRGRVLIPGIDITWPSPTLGKNGVNFLTVPNPAVANTTIEIRALVPQSQTTGRFSSMKDRRPSNGYTTNKQFNVAKYSTQSGYEKRRLLSRRPKRSFGLTYVNVSGVEKEAIENFYNARNGEYETFTFDLTHINDSGTVRTRFNGPLEIQQVASSGTALLQNFYSIRLNLQEDFD